MTDGLNEDEQNFLLNLARETLESYIKNGRKPKVDASGLSENLKRVRGGFVTLKKNGELRGCIGHIIPHEPLYKCVIDNAINAAFHDSRFPQISYEELSEIKIEISVLSVPKKLDYSSPKELLKKLVPLKDGVILKLGWNQSTFLPPVWEEIPDKKEFMEYLCLKQGSSKECWKSPNAVIEIYNAQVFGEN